MTMTMSYYVSGEQMLFFRPGAQGDGQGGLINQRSRRQRGLKHVMPQLRSAPHPKISDALELKLNLGHMVAKCSLPNLYGKTGFRNGNKDMIQKPIQALLFSAHTAAVPSFWGPATRGARKGGAWCVTWPAIGGPAAMVATRRLDMLPSTSCAVRCNFVQFMSRKTWINAEHKT